MEALVRRIAEWGLEDPAWHGILDALRDGGLTLPRLLKASNEGRLEHLKRMVQDPPLADAIAEYERTGVDYQTANGLRMLQAMAERELGSDVRFGELRTGKTITLLCARAEQEGGRPTKEHPAGSPLSHNYVHRSMRNAASKLIAFHWGRAERDRIFADVDFAAEDDTRDVWLNAAQLQRLLEACEPWFRPFVLVAATTGADRAPLLRLRVRDVQVATHTNLPGGPVRIATLFLRDRKNDSRPRSVAVAGPPADALARLVQGKAIDDPVFTGPVDELSGRPGTLTSGSVRYWFEKARAAAGYTKEAGFVDDLRFKDLRHTAGVAFEQAGFSVTQIGAGLGHKRRETSLKYTKRQLTLGPEEALKVARQFQLLGQPGQKQKAAGGSQSEM